MSLLLLLAVAPAATGQAEPSRNLDDAGISSFDYDCFGYVGTFRDGTTVRLYSWQTASPECFGIAPDRTIWHTWPGAGRWYEMPGNGRADDTSPNFYESSDGFRTVEVWVADGTGFWCQFLLLSSGWAGYWYDC